MTGALLLASDPFSYHYEPSTKQYVDLQYNRYRRQLDRCTLFSRKSVAHRLQAATNTIRRLASLWRGLPYSVRHAHRSAPPLSVVPITPLQAATKSYV